MVALLSECRDCDGLGKLWGEDGRPYRCHCLIPTIAECMELAGVPPKERGYTRSSMPSHLEPYRTKLVKALGQRRSVIISGPTGRGKTGLAVVGLRHLAEAWLKAAHEAEGAWTLPAAYYAFVPDYIKALRAAVGRGEGVSSEEDAACRADLFIMDDVGEGYKTDYAREETKYLLHHRDLWERPTIVTTTLNHDGMVAHYGAPFVSRLGGFLHVELPGELPDLRRER